MVQCEQKRQNAGKTQAKMVKQEQKWQNTSKNSNMRANMAKLYQKWQNASKNGKT